MASRFTYTNGRLKGYIAALPAKAERIASKIAHDIEASAKERAPVDTGHLRGSIQAAPVSPGVWRVTVGADYGIFVEFGHVAHFGGIGPSRFVKAQPYFYPAFTEMAKHLEALAKVELAP